MAENVRISQFERFRKELSDESRLNLSGDLLFGFLLDDDLISTEMSQFNSPDSTAHLHDLANESLADFLIIMSYKGNDPAKEYDGFCFFQ